MASVANLLSKGMDSRVRAIIERRVGFMIGQIEYLEEHEDETLIAAKRAGWTTDRLQVLCWINSFFQMVVSPLAASAVTSEQIDLGGSTRILYGEQLKFDSESRANNSAMVRAFYAICGASNIDTRMLSAHHAKDLIYVIAQRSTQ